MSATLPPFQPLLDAIHSVYPVGEPIFEAINGVATRRSFPKGAVVLSEGQVSNEIYFIEKGLVRAFYYDGSREITSWLANEGRFIWPLPSYLQHRPSRETIQLLEPSTLIILPRRELDELKRTHEELSHVECRVMERYILLYDLRIRLLLIPKAEKRLEAFAVAYPDFHRRVPLRHIAT